MCFKHGFVTKEFVHSTVILAEQASVAEPVVFALSGIDSNDENLLWLDQRKEWDRRVQLRVLGVSFS